MTKETLNEQRPSNDDLFTNQVIDRIRLANPLEDFPRIAELLSADAFETTAAQDLLDGLAKEFADLAGAGALQGATGKVLGP